MKKSKILVGLFTVITLVVVMVACSGEISASDTYVTVDINPSVELVINKREKVVYVNALNEDAEILLIDLELIGLNVEDAMDLIIEKSIELGFIDVDSDETIVSVSSAADTELGLQVKAMVKNAINNAFLNRGMMGKAVDKVFSEEFLAEADSYGVSASFLFLAYNATYVDDTLTLEDALLLTQEELAEMVKDAREEFKNIAATYKEAFIADRQEIRDIYMPQRDLLLEEIASLEAQIELATDDLETLEAQLLVKQDELATLINEYQGEVEALRNQYYEETEAMRTTYQETKTQRQAQYSERVQNWLRNKESRRAKFLEAIKAYQNKENE
jgi:hypothetical protein